MSIKQVVLGGIRVDCLSRKEWAERIAVQCKLPRAGDSRPHVTFAANGQVVALYASSARFRSFFNQADSVCADGQPLVWASKFTNNPLPERVATTDLFHDVAREAEKSGLSFYFLGSSERSNALIEQHVRKFYPKVRIAGRRNGYFRFDEEQNVIESIKKASPDILWIGLGVPLQESFVARNRNRFAEIGCILTCGGLFDYFTDEVKRAPRWMQNFALEWSFRTWQEPKKYLRRYLMTNPPALWLLLTQTHSAEVVGKSRHLLEPANADRTKRLMLVASGGGHWVQLSRLSPAFEGYNTLYATTMRGTQAPSGSHPVAVVSDASRSRLDKMVFLIAQLFWLVLKFQPDVVITTGAAPGLIALRIGKLFGAKTVWIDSLANAEKISMSASLAEPYADLWLTQWPDLVKHHSNLNFIGSVL